MTDAQTPAFHHPEPSTLKSVQSVGFGMRLDERELDDGGGGGVGVGWLVRQGDQADNQTGSKTEKEAKDTRCWL